MRMTSRKGSESGIGGPQILLPATLGKRHSLMLVLIASVAAAAIVSEQRVTVRGFGGYQISPNITTLWLRGPEGPVVMVYFCGPNEWHNTLWKMDSKFEKGKGGWAELQSEIAKLRLEIDTKTGQVRVQSTKFKISERNTFLVLHSGEPEVLQKIIPLGKLYLPPSKDQPASILLLRAHPELVERIKLEIRAGDHNSKVRNSTRHDELTRPCSERRDLLPEDPIMLGAALRFPTEIPGRSILRTTYSVPCCLKRLGSCK